MHVKSHAQELTHVSTKPKATRENMYIMTVQNMTAQEKYLSALLLRCLVRGLRPTATEKACPLGRRHALPHKRRFRDALTAALLEKLYRQQLTLSKPSR